MSTYDRALISADKILTKYGQSLLLSHKAAGTYSPSTGLSTVVITNQAGVGALFEQDSKVVDGTLIKHGDKQLILSAVDITEPAIGDTVTISNRVFAITEVKPLAPGGTTVLYELNIRGSS